MIMSDTVPEYGKKVIPESILHRPYKQVALSNTLIRDLLPKVDQYQRRLLFLLVKESWQNSKGQKLNDTFDVHSWTNHTYTFRTRDLLFDGDEEKVSYALDCCSRLLKVQVPFKFGEKRRFIGETTFLSGWIHEIGSGEVTVSVNDITWQAMYNFASHYQNADIFVCLSLKKYPAFLLYTYVYDQDTFEIGLDKLKEQLGLSGKYKKFKDFEEAVLRPAQAELDAVSPRSFTFETIQEVHRRGKPITGIRFYAKNIAANKSIEQAKIEAKQASHLSKQIQILLIEKIRGFDTKDVKGRYSAIDKNFLTLSKAEEIKGTAALEDFIRKITPDATRANNPIGYTINAIKKWSGQMDNGRTSQEAPVRREHIVSGVQPHSPTASDLSDGHISSLGDILGSGNLFDNLL